MLPITAFAITILILFLITVGVGAYFYIRENRKLLPSTVDEDFDFIIEAVGGFSSGRITALSTSAIPGMPYDISLFAGKTPFIPVAVIGIKKKRKWVRHGEIKPANIGMNRF